MEAAQYALQVLKDAGVVHDKTDIVMRFPHGYFTVEGTWNRNLYLHFVGVSRTQGLLHYLPNTDSWNEDRANSAYQKCMVGRRRQCIQTVLDRTNVSCEGGLGRLVAEYCG